MNGPLGLEIPAYRKVTADGVSTRCGSSLNPSTETREPLNRNVVSDEFRTRQFSCSAAIGGAPRQLWTATPIGPPEVKAASLAPRLLLARIWLNAPSTRR